MKFPVWFMSNICDRDTISNQIWTNFKVGDVVEEPAECQTCTCAGAGAMSCVDLACPVLSCAADEVQAQKDDSCCGYCAADWVKVSLESDRKKGAKLYLQPLTWLATFLVLVCFNLMKHMYESQIQHFIKSSQTTGNKPGCESQQGTDNSSYMWNWCERSVEKRHHMVKRWVPNNGRSFRRQVCTFVTIIWITREFGRVARSF